MNAVSRIMLNTIQAIAGSDVMDPAGYAQEVLKGLRTRTGNDDICPVCDLIDEEVIVRRSDIVVLSDNGHERQLACLRCGQDWRTYHDDPDCE